MSPSRPASDTTSSSMPIIRSPPMCGRRSGNLRSPGSSREASLQRRYPKLALLDVSLGQGRDPCPGPSERACLPVPKTRRAPRDRCAEYGSQPRVGSQLDANRTGKAPKRFSGAGREGTRRTWRRKERSWATLVGHPSSTSARLILVRVFTGETASAANRCDRVLEEHARRIPPIVPFQEV